ncbi:Na+/H+ antiporter NhaA [bacterium]|nr:Na+/H+ antiporter NhaA [bacterium]
MNTVAHDSPSAQPRGTDLAAPVRLLWEPLKSFGLAETSSGIILLAATVAALLWANLCTSGYNGFWETKGTLSIGRFTIEHSLRDWVNDGLMTIFFLSVGLEIKREMLVGELSSFRQAILPVVAAAGGMLIPALLFSWCAWDSDMINGWGIPTATDIAFALGAITMVGKNLPPGLRIFLVALAIADDLGAVLVIALFYSSGINIIALLWAGMLFVFLCLCNRMGIRWWIWYAAWGLFLWFLVSLSGIHATIAGVLLAISIPSWTRFDLPRYVRSLHISYHYLERRSRNYESTLADARLLSAIDSIDRATKFAQPTLHQVESTLSPWVSFVIMPLFALANAGVAINNVSLDILREPLAHGIAAGLIIGKPLGIFLGTFIIVKLGLASLPRYCNWSHILGMGMLGGIGFTMALFVAGLSVHSPQQMDIARLSILCSSFIACIIGFIFLRLQPPYQTQGIIKKSEMIIPQVEEAEEEAHNNEAERKEEAQDSKNTEKEEKDQESQEKPQSQATEKTNSQATEGQAAPPKAAGKPQTQPAEKQTKANKPRKKR